MAAKMGDLELSKEMGKLTLDNSPEKTRDSRRPSQVQDAFGVHFNYGLLDNIYGKWMVFDHYDKIDETWEKICKAMVLTNCSAKCSTMKYDPTKEGPGPSTTAVICVYTEKEDRRGIGLKLIDIVKRDISYKTNESTGRYEYAHAGTNARSRKERIYWNDGNPSEYKRKCTTLPDKEDIWHVNVVRAPFNSKRIDGCWIMQLEYKKLTELWHFLKEIIESREKNPGIIKMECPPKKEKYSRTEKPIFEVHTSDEDKHSVGKMLTDLVKRYCESASSHPGTTLFWNGETDYTQKDHENKEA